MEHRQGERPAGDLSSSSSSIPPPPTATATAAATWRNPTIQQQQTYRIRPISQQSTTTSIKPFVPTKAEQQLLEMYEVLRSYERTAARSKEEAAKAKLLAREAEFQQQQQQLLLLQNNNNNADADPPRNKRQRRHVKQPSASGNTYQDDDDDDDDDDSEDFSHDEDEEEEEAQPQQLTKRARRDAKLAALREQVDAAKQAARDDDDDDDRLRQQHLATTTMTALDDDHGPTLMKKNKQLTTETGLLTANMIRTTTASTTSTDFFQSLGPHNTGQILFPRDDDDENRFVWNPPTTTAVVIASPNDGALALVLPDFDIQFAQNGAGNNTIAIQCAIPSDSKRFSINIAGPSHEDYNSVLFHFNPRRERGGQLIVNDKQDGIWGPALSIPLSQLPLLFGQTSCTIMIQINGEGYDMFVDNVHCARLEHRTELPVGKTNLYLQFPSTDDSLKPENWTVYKVWWGHRPLMAKGDVSGIPGVNSFSSDHPRKIFIGNLSRISTESEVEIRRAELERAFQRYGGDRGVQVMAPMNKTYAFVEMESEHMTDLALRELGSTYHMNRARRSRHEALREERAAAAAAASGTAKKTGSAWD